MHEAETLALRPRTGGRWTSFSTRRESGSRLASIRTRPVVRSPPVRSSSTCARTTSGGARCRPRIAAHSPPRARVARRSGLRLFEPPRHGSRLSPRPLLCRGVRLELRGRGPPRARVREGHGHDRRLRGVEGGGPSRASGRRSRSGAWRAGRNASARAARVTQNGRRFVRARRCMGDAMPEYA